MSEQRLDFLRGRIGPEGASDKSRLLMEETHLGMTKI
ncbi:hypothetical protein FBY12_2452 [Pseudomonas sp. SJZ131]|nr:hypothetical protein FBY12_2452 [Pseudomonas sp. SJZ131]